MAGDERVTLLALQQALSEEQFQAFKFLLGGRLPLAQLGPATRPQLCALLLQHFPGRALHVAADLLRHIARHDLLQLHGLPGADPPHGGPGAAPPPPPGGPGGAPPPPPPGCGEEGCRPPPRLLTEQELIQVAQKLGKEWREVGIACLGLEGSRLEQIREDNPRSAVLQSFEMLREWRRREKGGATAPRLRARLAAASLDPEVFDLLLRFQGDGGDAAGSCPHRPPPSLG